MDGRRFYRYQTTKGLGWHHLKFRFVSTDSPYDQGIALGFSTDPAFRGKVYLDGLHLARPKKKYEKLVISEGDWLEREFVLDVSIEQGYMTFSNASDTLPDYADLEKLKQVSQQTGIPLERLQQKVYTSGFKDAHRTANGFWIEQLSPSCYRFHCNDHALDDDFDDMIFELEVIEAPAKGTEGMEE